MAQRGIASFQEAFGYFQPKIEDLHSPFIMLDMQSAVERIGAAISNNEHIVVYGDYDVDGTTAVALVYSFLHSIYSNVSFYIPDRFKEGYGISFQGIDHAEEVGAKLIIALDCGIKSVEHTEYASAKAIDFVICDHHTPGDDLPKAAAILNPKRSDCPYPYKELSGCGIGFKLVQALITYLKKDTDPKEYLDLVAISIVSDIVHMTGENRTLTYYGLQKINQNPRPGVKALMKAAGVKAEMNVNDLVFKLGPRINAAGRMGSGALAVKMLIENDEEEALKIAGEINGRNANRQNIDKDITVQALEMIEKQGLTDKKTTVLFNKEWHKGVIGIVASRLIDKYYRPTILLTESNGMAVGSARSVEGFNLYNAIKECEGLLAQWGGHQAAAGLTLPLDKIDELREKFEEAVGRSIDNELLIPALEYDLEIALTDITMTFCRSISRFGPFGPENNEPVFATKNVRLKGSPRIVGNNHLQMTVSDGDVIGHRAIAFGFGGIEQKLLEAETFDICYTVEVNKYRGYENVSLNIKDIRF